MTTAHPDDLVIVVAMRETPQPAREQAQAERTAERTQRKRRHIVRRLQQARAARRVATGAARRAAGGGLMRGAGAAAKAGSRAIPVAGWALLLADLTVLGGQMARRFGGKSGRLVEADDADAMLGVLDEEVTANAEVAAAIESDSEALRSVGREGTMPGSLRAWAGKMKDYARRQAIGADQIQRDSALDSADSLLDKLIMRAEDADLKGAADRALDLLRREGYGSTKGGR